MAPVKLAPNARDLLDRVQNPPAPGQDFVAVAELGKLGYHESSAWKGELVRISTSVDRPAA